MVAPAKIQNNCTNGQIKARHWVPINGLNPGREPRRESASWLLFLKVGCPRIALKGAGRLARGNPRTW
jgi:hypothetical protein